MISKASLLMMSRERKITLAVLLLIKCIAAVTQDDVVSTTQFSSISANSENIRTCEALTPDPLTQVLQRDRDRPSNVTCYNGTVTLHCNVTFQNLHWQIYTDLINWEETGVQNISGGYLKLPCAANFTAHCIYNSITISSYTSRVFLVTKAEERLDPITGNTISSTITTDNPATESRKSNQITGKQNSNSTEGSPKECKQNNAWGYYAVLAFICGAGAVFALFICLVVILYFKNDRDLLMAFTELSKFLGLTTYVIGT